MMSILLLIVGLLLFVGLVVVHEFGHFLAARRGGVDVEEFGIGFPPRAWSRKVHAGKGMHRHGFLFSINWLPLGGFVKLKGEHDSDTEPGSFGAAPFGVKVRVMLAGVGMNLLAAFVLFMILAWVGMPHLVDHQFTVASDSKISRQQVMIGLVSGGSPAAKAGLKTRDQLTSIGIVGHMTSIKSADTLPSVTQKFAGQTVVVQYVRSGSSHQTTAHLLTTAEVQASRNTNQPKGYLGIAPTEYTLTRSTWSAPVVSLGLMKQFTVLTFKGLGSAVASLGRGLADSISPSSHMRHEAKANFSNAGQNVSGPVGIVVLLRDGSLLGFQFVLMIIAIISLTLAIMNVLPIPALDGGRLFVTLISRISGKQVSQTAEERIYGTGFMVLMLLVVVITIVDVKRYF